MISLVFTACSILVTAKGAPCRPIKADYDVSLFECMMRGQIEMAKWVAAHPNWYIAPGGYRCIPPSAYANT